MDEKNIEYKVNVDELLKQLFNGSMNKMLIDAIPEAKEKETICKIISSFK